MRDLDGLSPYDLECIINEQDQRLGEVKDMIDKIWDAAYESPELNMSNYNHDEVVVLNDAMCEVFGLIDELRSM